MRNPMRSRRARPECVEQRGMCNAWWRTRSASRVHTERGRCLTVVSPLCAGQRPAELHGDGAAEGGHSGVCPPVLLRLIDTRSIHPCRPLCSRLPQVAAGRFPFCSHLAYLVSVSSLHIWPLCTRGATPCVHSRQSASASLLTMQAAIGKLTETCFDKCVTKPGAKLDSSEVRLPSDPPSQAS